MITEQQLKNFKGMRTYGELDQIKGQLMDIFNQLYDMDIDTSDAKNEVVRAINCVYKLQDSL